MFIECHQARPVPSFSSVTDKPKNSMLALSALCNNLSQYTHHLPGSSRVTSPAQSTISQEQISTHVSHMRHSSQSPQSSPENTPFVASNTGKHLPSISHFHFPSNQNTSASQLPAVKLQLPSHPRRPFKPCLNHVTPYQTQPHHGGYPCRLPPHSTPPRVPLTPSPPKLSSKHHNGISMSADHSLPHPHKFRTCPLSPIADAPQTMTTNSRRRYSAQTSSRTCTNCSIAQTRQWVRGENHAWLCHSCGQFWRKNGYARPRALWNRPTFKRTSRKSRMVSHDDASKRFKPSTRQNVSSSFLNGKKMIQWEIQLPPLQGSSEVFNRLGDQAGFTGGSVTVSAGHTSRKPTEDTSKFESPKLQMWKSPTMAL